MNSTVSHTVNNGKYLWVLLYTCSKTPVILLFDKTDVLYVSMCSEHHKVIVIQRRPVGRKMANDHVC